MIVLKGKRQEFFDLFEESTENIHQGSKVLSQLLEDYNKLGEISTKLKSLEEEVDKITEKIMEKIHETFATPLEPEDLFRVAKNLDDIIDGIWHFHQNLVIYQIKDLDDYIRKGIGLIKEMTSLIKKAFHHLKKLNSNQGKILDICQQIGDLETKGDSFYAEGLSYLFNKETDPIQIIKKKEVYDSLEQAIDSCEEVSDLLKGVVLKYA